MRPRPLQERRPERLLRRDDGRRLHHRILFGQIRQESRPRALRLHHATRGQHLALHAKCPSIYGVQVKEKGIHI